MPSVDPAEAEKPRREPEPPPPPPPVKPNARGEIDLSNDPATKSFSEFLHKGYDERLQRERGATSR